LSNILTIDDPITAAEIGRCLELRRLSRGISQKELSDLVGLPKYRIDAWESGHGLLHSVKLFAAFEACGCSVKIAPTETLKALLRSRV
jgi:transcriptional regulator with XRE-family HTH domain